MNIDYSKVFELINQDAEKKRNKKLEKAVHDNLYNKGFRDGLAVLDKIRAEIEDLDRFYDNDYFSVNNCPMYKCNEVLLILDKYKAEQEET